VAALANEHARLVGALHLENSSNIWAGARGRAVAEAAAGKTSRVYRGTGAACQRDLELAGSTPGASAALRLTGF
jgi:hypothetical protein